MTHFVYTRVREPTFTRSQESRLFQSSHLQIPKVGAPIFGCSPGPGLSQVKSLTPRSIFQENISCLILSILKSIHCRSSGYHCYRLLPISSPDTHRYRLVRLRHLTSPSLTQPFKSHWQLRRATLQPKPRPCSFHTRALCTWFHCSEGESILPSFAFSK